MRKRIGKNKQKMWKGDASYMGRILGWIACYRHEMSGGREMWISGAEVGNVYIVWTNKRTNNNETFWEASLCDEEIGWWRKRFRTSSEVFVYTGQSGAFYVLLYKGEKHPRSPILLHQRLIDCLHLYWRTGYHVLHRRLQTAYREVRIRGEKKKW